MRALALIVIALSILICGGFLPATAQSLNPVIEGNSVDGLLLGAEGSYRFFGWLKPSLGLAYGLQSQKIRYKAGISVWDVTLWALDWPRTAVLGRVGERGLKAALKLPILPIVSGFVGTLWPWTQDPNPPDVAYVMWESSHNIQMPLGIELGLSQRTLVGWWQLGVLPSEFRYTQTNLSVRYEALSMSFSYGTLENTSNFPDFIFTQGVKGDSELIRGDQFWSLQFKRAFDVMTISVPLLVPSLELLVQGGVFLHVSSAGKLELPSDEQQEHKRVWQNRLSWGVSVLLLLPREVGIKVRLDFVFIRDGKFQFLFSL